MGMEVTIDGSHIRNVSAAAADTGAIARNGLDPSQPVMWNMAGDHFYQYDSPTSLNPPKEFQDEELSKRVKADEAKRLAAKTPRPASASPAPPELVPDDSSAIAVCLAPDVCKSPENPVPYMSWGKASDLFNYSPDVRSNGLVIKRQDSKFSRCYGDEGGVGLGCKSETVGDVVEPVTWSSIVRANGVWVQRHGDRCTLNNGNTEGEYVNVKSTDVHQPPDGTDDHDKAWYEKAWDWTSGKAHDAGQAVGQWVNDHPRTMGAVQAVGGVFEGVGSSALIVGGTGADLTGVGAPVGVAGQALGVAGLVNASDNVSTGLRQMWYGTPQKTVAVEATGAAARAMGATPDQVQTAESVVNAGQIVLGGVAGAGGAIRQSGSMAARGVASESGAIAETEAKTAGRTVEEGVETTGEQGARSTRKLSARLKYLGKTPGKYSRTGREVRERMREEGLIRTNRRGQDEFLDENNVWRPVDSPQTHMGHYPMDAVDYWNSEGRLYGAKSQEVRDWMLNSDNYRFEWGPSNSARGGQTTSRYLPPAE